MQQDYRALYLAWLKAITLLDVDEEEYEPPVPLGLRKLSRSLSAFVELFEVDEYLLEVAAKSSGEQRAISDDTLLQAITKLSREECNAFLLRLANGEPHVTSQ